MIWIALIYFLIGVKKILMVFSDSNPGMKPMWMHTSRSIPSFLAYFILYSLAWPFIREPSLWKVFKDFFTGDKALDAYYSRLKEYRLEPKARRYSPAVDLVVIRLARKSYADLLQQNRKMAEMISLEYKMEYTAELVAMCVLGPTEFKKHPSQCDVTWEGTIVDAAKSLIEKGGSSSYDLQIIEAVVAEHAFSREFAEAFDGLLHFT